MKDLKKYIKEYNKGSTLVTVVVVVAFMSILATIILYLAGENYKTKAIDQKTKDSFYDAEVVVEQIKTQLAIKSLLLRSKHTQFPMLITSKVGIRMFVKRDI